MTERKAASDASRAGWRDCLGEGRLFFFVLVCFGVWLTATDSLITATIMPDVGADLGGYAYFGWAVAGFMLGVVVASASAGRISERFGLRGSSAVAGIVFAFGCAAAAASQNMAWFLFGRLVQGIGGGWISGLAMVVIGLVFPRRHIARVFAATAAVWGVATVLGPLIGGIFAEWGEWRWVFWLYALQAGIFAFASLRLPSGLIHTSNAVPGFPWRQLVMLAAAIGFLGVAGLFDRLLVSLGLVTIGLFLLILLVCFDRRAAAHLLPRTAGDPRSVAGAGYVAMFALTAASVGLNAYGPAILQQLHGLSALSAGYAVAAMAVTWSLAALFVASVDETVERMWIVIGSMLVLLGTVGLAFTTPWGTVASFVTAASVMGLGFGFSSSLMNRRLIGTLAQDDKATGSSALISVRQTGGAAGAAVAGTVANLVGFDQGLSESSAQAAGFWVFAVASVPALVGVLAAWQMVRESISEQSPV